MGQINNGIIEHINTQAHTINKLDIGETWSDGWMVPELLDYYSSKISSLASYVYGSSVGHGAFKEYAAKTLHKGIESYILKKQYWRYPERNIDTYLITCLNRLAEKLKADAESKRRINVPVCPACRDLGGREFLYFSGDMLRCAACEKETARLEQCSNLSKHEEYELSIRKVFMAHTRKGYRCPDCERFIPASFVKAKNSVSCPYDNCSWFGVYEELEPMNHPMGVSTDGLLSINLMAGRVDDGSGTEWQNYFHSDIVLADVHMEVEQKCHLEFDVVKEVIETQMGRVMKEPKVRSIKKQLMYQAYKNMLDRSPEDMISYLAHRKVNSELPIQAQIFQEFVRLIDNARPFKLRRFGEIYDIYSLLDKNLDLFLGSTDYEATVRHDGLVPNLTPHTYVGGREHRNFGRCFIGLLLDIVSNSGSLMDKVEYYTFSQIKLIDVPIGTRVKVTHLYMPSHYEMNGLVQLQRIRRKIVDSVYQRLHGKKREIKQRDYRV